MIVGSKFGVWSGAYASPLDRVVVMVCVVTGGYHSLTTYQWKKDGENLESETFPVIYTQDRGKYTCQMTIAESGQVEEHSFRVESMYIHLTYV